MKVHRSLKVWQKSIDLTVQIYALSEKFPRGEEYGLKSQVRRAAVSIPSNIAEGAARQTKKEFTQFLYIAAGSASEIDTQVELALRLGYLKANEIEKITQDLEQVSKMIFGLIKSQRVRLD